MSRKDREAKAVRARRDLLEAPSSETLERYLEASIAAETESQVVSSVARALMEKLERLENDVRGRD
jgi:hypothetical protein